MRPFILSLTLLLCLSGLSSAEEGADRAAVQSFLEEFELAAKAEDAGALRKFFDIDAVMAHLHREGVFSATPAAEKERVEGLVRSVLEEEVGECLLSVELASLELQFVRKGAEASVLVAQIRSGVGAGGARTLRLYLRRQGEQLRLFELEQVELGIGLLVSTVSVIVDTALSGGVPSLMLCWRRFEEATALWSTSAAPDVLEQVQGLLEEALLFDPPAVLRLMVQLSLVHVSLDRGRYADALAHADKAAALRPDVPILHALRARAYNLMDRPKDALREAQVFIAAVGENPAVDMELGLALYALERKPEAVTALRKALAERPVDATALAYLALSLPTSTQAEIGPLFAKLEDPVAEFDAIGEICMEEKAPATMLLFSKLFRKQHPIHYLLSFYEGRAAMLARDYARAAPAFWRTLQRLEDEPGQVVIPNVYAHWYLAAMSSQGKYLEALDAAPERVAAFRYLAGVLLDHENPKVLLELVSRVEAEPDLLLERGVYTGHAHFLGKHYDEAVAVLRPLRVGLRGWADDNEAGVQMLWDLEDRLLRSLVRAKEPGLDEALVLAQEIALRDDDWTYLAIVFAHRGDVSGVRALLEKAIESEDDARQFFEDEDLKELLAGDAYKAVRAKHLPKR